MLIQFQTVARFEKGSHVKNEMTVSMAFFNGLRFFFVNGWPEEFSQCLLKSVFYSIPNLVENAFLYDMQALII